VPRQFEHAGDPTAEAHEKQQQLKAAIRAFRYFLMIKKDVLSMFPVPTPSYCRSISGADTSRESTTGAVGSLFLFTLILFHRHNSQQNGFSRHFSLSNLPN
jgi:hypothetical protein